MTSYTESYTKLLAKARSEWTKALLRQYSDGLPNSVYYRDYEQGLMALYEHIQKYTPEVLGGGLTVVDVGPGVGCFMALAQAFGNTVYGEELPLDSSKWVTAYAKVTQFWKLNVRHHGFHRYLKAEPFPYEPESVDLFHFRGSLDGVLLPFKDELDDAVQRLVDRLTTALRPGGFVQIHHNADAMMGDIVSALRRHAAPLTFAVDERSITRMVKP